MHLKYLITGGSGFIGTALVKSLIDKYKSTVVNIDKLTYAANELAFKDYANNDKYIFYQTDICDVEEISNILTIEEPDKIIHLAAESHVDRSIKSSSDFIQTNIIGTYNLLEVSKKYFEGLEGKKKKLFTFHHVSTDEVFGDLEIEDPGFNELTSYNPSSPYSASKASSDHLVRAWSRTYGLPIYITNCSNNYGPRQNQEKLIPTIINKLLNKKNIPIYGSGKQIRDWLYVYDHAEAIIKVSNSGFIGHTFNIGGNAERTNLEVVKAIWDVLKNDLNHPCTDGRYFEDIIEHVTDRPGHDLRYAIDPAKILNKLSWKPSETFESGFKKTIEWYINNS
ncbi:dTDP-glucose 4,6-dehydratase [Gammaproteobacteria bacterium]|jgi:dTDP-glucose 4,6-dehydratase|nr:dTDP-glucose 4,6-dehydratase [Gammaproteobacteria bacterium]